MAKKCPISSHMRTVELFTEEVKRMKGNMGERSSSPLPYILHVELVQWFQRHGSISMNPKVQFKLCTAYPALLTSLFEGK